MEVKNFSSGTLEKFSLAPSRVNTEPYYLNLDILAYWNIDADKSNQTAIAALESIELPIALASCDEDQVDYFQAGKERERIDKDKLTRLNNSKASQTNFLPLHNELDKLFNNKIEIASTINDARNKRNVEAKEFLKKFNSESQNESNTTEKEPRIFTVGGIMISAKGFELTLSFLLKQRELGNEIIKSYSDQDIVIAAALHNYGKELTPEQIDQFVGGIELMGFGDEEKRMGKQ